MIVTILKLFISIIFAFKVNTQTYMYNYAEPNSDWTGICTTGQEQSPIDFPANFTLFKEDKVVKVLATKYGPLANGLLNGTLSVVGNRYIFTGTNLGSIEIEKNGVRYSYDLVDISFHVPSEHTFFGYHGALEMHINHKKNTDWLTLNSISNADTRDSELKIAVIFKIGSYYENPNIARLNVATRSTDSVLNFNLGVFPPIGKPFFFYEGSLTEPACGEYVNWFVLHKMELISQNQYNAFQEWISTTYTALNVPTLSNARSTKPIYARSIYYQIYPNQQIVELSSMNLRTSLLLLVLYTIFFY